MDQIAKDAVEYGTALNDASWAAIDACPDGIHYNDVKTAVRAAILCYLEKQGINTKPE